MNMFEFFKYMNVLLFFLLFFFFFFFFFFLFVFFSKSKYMNGVDFQILAYKSIPKSPVDTPPPPEA